MDKQYDHYQRADNRNSKYGRSWRTVRERYARAHPYCERCLSEGRMTMMDEVHHIIPVSRGGANDEENLMSLCQSCHNKIHHDLGDR